MAADRHKSKYLKPLNIEELRAYCLRKPAVTEGLPFGEDTLVFKVFDKAFLLTSLSSAELRFNVKCDPDRAVELREKYSCVLPGYHMNKKHWNTIIADGSEPDKLLFSWIDHSYDLVVSGMPKKKQLEIAAL